MDNDIQFRNDDELLSAYMDGELPLERAAALERRLEREPALALRLERLSGSDATLRVAFASVDDEPIPQKVLDQIDARAAASSDHGRATSQGGTVVELGARRREREREPGAFPWSLALAASVTLAIGTMIGYFVAPQGSAPESGLLASTGSVARGSRLHDALENLPSGDAREIATGLAVTAVLSFESRDGGYCRELAIAGADGSAAALACRRDGGWQVEALGFEGAPAPGNGPQGGEFRPAGRASSAIDAAVDARIAGDPLDAAAESALIERGWIPR